MPRSPRTPFALSILFSAGLLAAGGAATVAGGTLPVTPPSGKLGDGGAAWPAGWEAVPLGEISSYVLTYNRRHRSMLHGPAPSSDGMETLLGGRPGPKLRETSVERQYLLSPLGKDGYALLLIDHTADLPLTISKDGKSSPAYGAVYDLQFSPDGSRWAYVATDRWDWKRPQVQENGMVVVSPVQSPEGQWWIVVDGKAGPVQPAVVPETLTFSPDGQRLAYAVQHSANSNSVVVDGQADPAFAAIRPGSLTFSPDGRRLAYAAREGRLWHLVVDGKKAETGYERVEQITFSPDGRRVAFFATDKGEGLVVVDGAATKSFPAVFELKFSEDSQHVQYLARDKDRSIAVWDGKASPGAEQIATPGLIVSPDGKRLVYARRLGNNWQVMEGGKGSPDYTGLAFHARRPPQRDEHDPYGNGAPGLQGPPVVFSPDSRHLAFAARRAARSFIVLDGTAQTPYAGALNPVFSSTGRLAYIAQDANQAFVVVDGRPGPKFQHVQPGTLRFSPDGRHLAYIVEQDGQVNVCVDGVPGVFVSRIVAGPEWRADGRAEYVTQERVDGVTKFTRVIVTPTSADTALPTRR